MDDGAVGEASALAEGGRGCTEEGQRAHKLTAEGERGGVQAASAVERRAIRASRMRRAYFRPNMVQRAEMQACRREGWKQPLEMMRAAMA